MNAVHQQRKHTEITDNKKMYHFTEDEIYRAMLEYKENINRLEGIIEELSDIYYQGLVARGGIESVMPKAKGGIGDVVFREYHRREEAFNRKNKVVDKLNLIVLYCASERCRQLRDRDYEILDATLSGQALNMTAKKIGISAAAVRLRVLFIAKDIKRYQTERNALIQKCTENNVSVK